MHKSAAKRAWRLSRANRRMLAVGIWLLGICLMAALGIWNMGSFKRDAESRLVSEAGRTAAQLSSLLAAPGAAPDASSARAIVAGAMEDDHIYAVKVQTPAGIIAGERRNYLWEPVPWDDEIAENCVQGTSQIRVNGRGVGNVDVWLSPRVNDEENSILSRRETWRFAIFSTLWTGVLLLLFWQWGDFRRLRNFLSGKAAEAMEAAEATETGVFEEHTPTGEDGGETSAREKAARPGGLQDDGDSGGQRGEAQPSGTLADSHPLQASIIDAEAGMKYQRRNSDAWLVTAGMFRQTFARGPSLISRLYAEGEIAGLCHLGRIIEQAAPCIGAQKLVCAARDMQAALNDPNCQASAIPVEECARALEEVLEALCGNGQWRSKPANTRS